MKHLFAVTILMLGGLILLSTVLGCSKFEWESTPSSSLRAAVTFSDSPILDKPVEVVARFFLSPSSFGDSMGTIPMKNVNLSMTIPDGFELVESAPADVQLDNNAQVYKHGAYEVGRALVWKGDIEFRQGVAFEIRATIKAVKTGYSEIEARMVVTNGGNAGVGSRVLYISVFKDRAKVSERPPRGR